MSDPRRALTLLEVLAALLVITIGIGSYLGMLRYGQRLSERASGQASGLATATTVLHDPEPLRSRLDPDQVRKTAGSPRRDEGWLNGYWVTRTESIAAADSVVVDGNLRQQWVEVEVSVYAGDALITTLRQRLLRNIR